MNPTLNHFKESNIVAFRTAVLACLGWVVVLILIYTLVPTENYVKLSDQTRMITYSAILVLFGFCFQQLYILIFFTSKKTYNSRHLHANLIFETFSFECKYGMKLAVLIGPCLLFLSLLLTVLYDTTPVVEGDYFQPPIYLISMSSIGFQAWIISPAQHMMESSDSKTNNVRFVVILSTSIPGLYKYVLNPLSNFISSSPYVTGQISGALMSTGFTIMFLFSLSKDYNPIGFMSSMSTTISTFLKKLVFDAGSLQVTIVNTESQQPTNSHVTAPHVTAPRMFLGCVLLAWYVNFGLCREGFYTHFPTLSMYGEIIKTTVFDTNTSTNTSTNEVFYIGEIVLYSIATIINVMYALEQYRQLLAHVINSDLIDAHLNYSKSEQRYGHMVVDMNNNMNKQMKEKDLKIKKLENILQNSGLKPTFGSSNELHVHTPVHTPVHTICKRCRANLYENKSCVNCLYRYGSVSPAPTEPAAPLRTADLERHTNAMEWEKLKKSCTHEDSQGIIVLFDWLSELNLAELIHRFHEHGVVNMTLMTWVTDQDLINYGFDQSARTSIRQGISEYKREFPEDRHFQSSSDSNVESASHSSSEVV